MYNRRGNIRYLTILILVLLSIVLIEKVWLKKTYTLKDVKRIEKIIQTKEEAINTIFDQVKQIDTPHFTLAINNIVSNIRTAQRGISILIYNNNDSLVYWSDNKFSSYSFNEFVINDTLNPVIYYNNTWILKRVYTAENFHLLGIIRIKTEYPYENQFLKASFQRDFELPAQVKIKTKKDDVSVPIKDRYQKILFYLQFDSLIKNKDILANLSISLYFLLLLLVAFYIRKLIKTFNQKWYLIFIPISTLILYSICRQFNFPGSLYSSHFFDPRYFAVSKIFSSLGDLFHFSLILLIFIYTLHSGFREVLKKYIKNYVNKYLYIAFMLIIIYCYVILIDFLFSNLIINSSITFQTYKTLDINLYSFAGLLIPALQFLALILLIDLAIDHIKLFTIEKKFALYIIAVCMVFSFVAILFSPHQTKFISIILLNLVIITVFISKWKQNNVLSFSYGVVLIVIFTIYSVLEIDYYTAGKEKDFKSVLAVNLSAQHDPVAEVLLNELDKKLKADTSLEMMVKNSAVSMDAIYEYLKKSYFNGYWNKYLYQISICGMHDQLYVQPPDDKYYPCYAFFDTLVRENGIKLAGTNFYYLDNITGRISYFGRYTYHFGIPGNEISLFIQLDSKLITEELGYPELLLQENVNKGSLLKNYSYAKYNKGLLVSRSGTCLYSLSSSVFDIDKSKEFSELTFDGFDHLIYRPNPNNVIVISSLSHSFFQSVVNFSYIFALYFLLVSLALIAIFNKSLLGRRYLKIKSRIQISFVSVLVFSLLIVGTGTTMFIIRQFVNKDYEILNEKMQSIYVELDRKFAFETHLSEDWRTIEYDNLDQLLIKFSDVFYTDINLYDPNGNLIATSRREIYNNGLMGETMNTEAFVQLSLLKKANFIHRERIGKLKYLSAYIPFTNSENKLLFYLNLPYFTKQNELKTQLANLIIAEINLLGLLSLLIITIAIFIANQITRPLQQIQSKLSQLQFGEKTEYIQYTGKDEIGSLVSEYNRMVDELVKSAELLAKSERELAWREMAKQIAHEIKNPLTPMKLNIQHLQRSWNGDSSNKEIDLQKVTQTLIEQIDNLSRIATAFSDFAKMPKTTNEKINLVVKIKNTISLFENTENIEFKFIHRQIHEAFVYADKEELSRAFINIIQNSMQAIPVEKKGLIEIEILESGNNYTIRFSDNGKGIPAEEEAKLFQPNFTTKSSGTGLGLAITKNIIETAGGNIDYSTIVGEGTTFVINLPRLR